MRGRLAKLNAYPYRMILAYLDVDPVAAAALAGWVATQDDPAAKSIRAEIRRKANAGPFTS